MIATKKCRQTNDPVFVTVGKTQKTGMRQRAGAARMRFVGFFNYIENLLFATFQGCLYVGGPYDQYVVAEQSGLPFAAVDQR